MRSSQRKRARRTGATRDESALDSSHLVYNGRSSTGSQQGDRGGSTVTAHRIAALPVFEGGGLAEPQRRRLRNNRECAKKTAPCGYISRPCAHTRSKNPPRAPNPSHLSRRQWRGRTRHAQQLRPSSAPAGQWTGQPRRPQFLVQQVRQPGTLTVNDGLDSRQVTRQLVCNHVLANLITQRPQALRPDALHRAESSHSTPCQTAHSVQS